MARLSHPLRLWKPAPLITALRMGTMSSVLSACCSEYRRRAKARASCTPPSSLLLAKSATLRLPALTLSAVDGIGLPLLRIRQRLLRIRSVQMKRPIAHSYRRFGTSWSPIRRVAVPRIRSGRMRAGQSQEIPDTYGMSGPT